MGRWNTFADGCLPSVPDSKNFALLQPLIVISRELHDPSVFANDFLIFFCKLLFHSLQVVFPDLESAFSVQSPIV